MDPLTVVLAVARRCAVAAHRRYSWLEFEDLEQELRIVGIRASETFDPSRGANLGGWLWMRMNFAVIDMVRDTSPLTRSEAAAGVPIPQVSSLDDAYMGPQIERGYDEIEAALAVEQILDAVPTRYAEVLREHFLDGVTQAAIADREGVDPSRICQRVREARRAARRQAA